MTAVDLCILPTVTENSGLYAESGCIQQAKGCYRCFRDVYWDVLSNVIGAELAMARVETAILPVCAISISHEGSRKD